MFTPAEDIIPDPQPEHASGTFSDSLDIIDRSK
jgi:hypothetical protein